jgi:hypothetical protein
LNATATIFTWSKLIQELGVPRVRINFEDNVANATIENSINGIKITDFRDNPLKNFAIVCDHTHIVRFCKFIPKKDEHNDMRIRKFVDKSGGELHLISLEYKNRKSVFLRKQ